MTQSAFIRVVALFVALMGCLSSGVLGQLVVQKCVGPGLTVPVLICNTGSLIRDFSVAFFGNFSTFTCSAGTFTPPYVPGVCQSAQANTTFSQTCTNMNRCFIASSLFAGDNFCPSLPAISRFLGAVFTCADRAPVFVPPTPGCALGSTSCCNISNSCSNTTTNGLCTTGCSSGFSATLAGNKTVCLSSRCLRVSVADCSRCVQCDTGYNIANDGSCQLVPNVTVASSAFPNLSASACNGSTISLFMDPGISRRAISFWNISAFAQSRFPNTTVPSIRSLSCYDSYATAQPTPSALLNRGFTFVNCTAVDTFGVSGSCFFFLQVLDNEPPSFTSGCTSLSFNTNAGSAFFTAPSFAPTATDNVLGTPSVNCTVSAGTQLFAALNGLPRVYPVSCTATDTSNNNNTCFFNVTITDMEPPVLSSCPAIATIPTNPSTNASTYAWTAPTAVDNVNGAVSVQCNYSSTQFVVGTTSVTCLARDAANNTASCNFSVTVFDSTPPSVSCPPSSVVLSVQPISSVVVNWSQPLATDNVGVVQRQIFLAGSGTLCINSICPTSYSGITSSPANFTFVAMDAAGNAVNCSWSITIVLPPDVDPPYFVSGCNASNVTSMVISASTDWDRPTAYVPYPPVTAFDARSFSALTYGVVSTPPGYGHLVGLSLNFPVGTTLLNFSATDAANNTAYCAFSVQVFDRQPPNITGCTMNNSWALNTTTAAQSATALIAMSSSCAANSPCLPGIAARDNVEVQQSWFLASSIVKAYSPFNFTSFPIRLPVGVHTLSYTAADPSNNTATCTQLISVADTEAPTISNCGDIVVPANANSALGALPCPNLIFADNVNVSTVRYTPSLVPGVACGTDVPIGVVNYTVVVNDTSGNQANCTFKLVVEDRQAPTITNCPPSITNTTEFNMNSTTISWPAVVGQDNSGGPVAIRYTPAVVSGQRFAVGLTSITVTATDPSGNQATCAFSITIEDRQPPTILNCPSNSTTGLIFAYTNDTVPGQGFGFYSPLPVFSVWDNVRVASSQYVPTPLPAVFPAGDFGTLLAFQVFDTAGNSISCPFRIKIIDREPPYFLNCPSNSTHLANFTGQTDRGKNTGSVAFPTISYTDNVLNGLTASYTSSPPNLQPSSTSFPVGTSLLTMTVQDQAGNTARCNFSATVVDREPPTFSFCPPSFVAYTTTAASTSGLASWNAPVALDNVELVKVNSSLSPGTYEIGEYNVTVIATDASGNKGNCTFSFTMQMNQGSASGPTGSSASSTNIPAIGGAAGAGGVVILLVVVLLLLRRAQKKKLQEAQQGYAELMAMSDEFILERARTIQMTLMAQKQAAPLSLEAINARPQRAFSPPPAAYSELLRYIVETLKKGLDRNELELGMELGKGEFGAVNEGIYKAGNKEKKVAVKQLLSAAVEDSRVRFLKEAAIMAQFDHPNIVQLIGVSVQPTDQPILIVLEYMHLGSLQSYLQSSLIKDQLEQLTLLRMAIDVCAGMVYLSEAGFVHRDLAARNVLIDKEMTCRIGDFGLSIDLATVAQEQDGIYSGSEGARIPIRWTPIEAILYRHFSTASDVWSFGILMWEIWSYAEMPYNGWANKKVVQMVQGGYRLPHPPGCPFDVYRLMIECWNKNPKSRIPFTRLSSALIDVWKQLGAMEPGTYGGDKRRDSLLSSGGDLYDNRMGDPGADSDEDGAMPTVGEDEEEGMLVGETDLSQMAAARAKRNKRAAGGAGASTPQLYDVGSAEPGEADTDGDEEQPAGAGAGAGVALYDVGGDEQRTVVSKPAAFAPRPSATVAELLMGQGRRRSSTQVAAAGLTSKDKGERVRVHGVGDGRLVYIGPHHINGEIMCGVDLDEPTGSGDGLFDDHRYFTCEPGHGVLMPAIFVQLLSELETSTTPTVQQRDFGTLIPLDLPAAAQAAPLGYLSVGPEAEQ